MLIIVYILYILLFAVGIATVILFINESIIKGLFHFFFRIQ